MYFLTLEAHPKPTHPDYGTVDGAFAAMFVNESLAGAAEAVAREFIEENGWDVVGLDQSYPVELELYPPGHPSREHFEQALVDGTVVTFHRWSVGAPDDDEEGTDAGAA